MARRVVVLLNAAAGSAAKADEVSAALREAGLDADVREVPGGRLREAAREAAAEKPFAVVAAGGDGTVSAVASALAGTSVPMGVLPLGTLNHFAKDLGMPLTLPEAARALAQGEAKAVDVAEMNGHVFVNNASVGVYPDIVRDRDAQRRRTGRGKWAAMGVAIARAMRRFPRYVVEVDLQDRVLRRATPFVFVGNNEYDARLATVGKRERLDGGTLCVLTAHPQSRLHMARMALVALLRPGRRAVAPGLDHESRPEVVVDAPRERVHVALDGEVRELTPPLFCRVRPGDLRVLAPRGGGA